MTSLASGLHLGYQRYSRQRMTSQIRSVADSSSLMRGEKRAILTVTCLAALCIGNLNHLFFWPEQQRGTGSCQFPFCLMKIAVLLRLAWGMQWSEGH